MNPGYAERMPAAGAPRRALILVRSDIDRDPRVRRQIEWLSEAGWVVDTVGLGDTHVPGVARHYPLGPGKRWTRTPFGTLVLYGLTGRVRRFRRLVTDGIDAELHAGIRDGQYALVIFNDTHLLGWVKDPAVFTPKARAAHLHADIHEYFPQHYPRNSLWSRLTRRHHEWLRALIGDPSWDTRSVVVDEIADLYTQELGIERPTVIMNAPAPSDLAPTPPHEPVRLVYHGKSELTRGLGEIIDAVGLLDDRFVLTMYLVGGEAVADALRDRSASFADRVRILPPVAFDDICATINAHDVGIVFFPPATRNHEVALPNKLFESIQARLGLVIGPTAPMQRVVDRFGNGIVSAGWSATDLAAALQTIDRDAIVRWKAASDAAAREVNSVHEGQRFLALIGGTGADD